MAGGRAQCNGSFFEPLPNSVLVAAKSSLQTVYVQKIIYSPTRFDDGTILSFIDSLTGQSVGQIAVLPLSVGMNTQFVLDLTAPDAYSRPAGPAGAPISKGANLVMSVIAGGPSGLLQVYAYQLPLFVTNTAALAAGIAPILST